MIVEIDQSGKLEQLNTATAVAYADSRRGGVWIPAKIKRKLMAPLRKKIPKKADLWPVLLALVIYLLISDLPADLVMIIDEEYTGKEKLIRQTLGSLLAQRDPHLWRGSIRFARIGKASPAHRMAWQIHREKNQQKVRRLSETEILALLL